MGYHRELEVACATLQKMKKRGIRILPGGDYGFAWIKHGTNAKDLEYFVRYLGFTPMEALLAATQLGGQIMMRGSDLGQVREGFLADLLLVDGDPLSNIAVLQQRERIVAVMKDGVFHREPERSATPRCMTAPRQRWRIERWHGERPLTTRASSSGWRSRSTARAMPC